MCLTRQSLEELRGLFLFTRVTGRFRGIFRVGKTENTKSIRGLQLAHQRKLMNLGKKNPQIWTQMSNEQPSEHTRKGI